MQQLLKQKIVASFNRLLMGRLLFVLLSTACLLSGPLPVLAQQKTIHGQVTNEKGTPVPGATVSVKGTSTGTSTNPDGQFTISAAKGATLVISNVGFAEKEVKVGDDDQIAIQLSTTTQSFDEVVVVGYGTQ